MVDLIKVLMGRFEKSVKWSIRRSVNGRFEKSVNGRLGKVLMVD
jgi:hypothetical protein